MANFSGNIYEDKPLVYGWVDPTVSYEGGVARWLWEVIPKVTGFAGIVEPPVVLQGRVREQRPTIKGVGKRPTDGFGSFSEALPFVVARASRAAFGVAIEIAPAVEGSFTFYPMGNLAELAPWASGLANSDSMSGQYTFDVAVAGSGVNGHRSRGHIVEQKPQVQSHSVRWHLSRGVVAEPAYSVRADGVNTKFMFTKVVEPAPSVKARAPDNMLLSISIVEPPVSTSVIPGPQVVALRGVQKTSSTISLFASLHDGRSPAERRPFVVGVATSKSDKGLLYESRLSAAGVGAEEVILTGYVGATSAVAARMVPGTCGQASLYSSYVITGFTQSSNSFLAGLIEPRPNVGGVLYGR